MRIGRYTVGESVVLHANLGGMRGGKQLCRIVGGLPSGENGEPQYLVRVGAETFDRRIVQSDIDRGATEHENEAAKADICEDVRKPWLAPLKTKSRK